MDLLTVTKEIAPKGKAYLVVRQGPGGAALEEALADRIGALREQGAEHIYLTSTDRETPLAEGQKLGPWRLSFRHEMWTMERGLGPDRPRPEGRLVLESLRREQGALWLDQYNRGFFGVPNSATYGEEELEELLTGEPRSGLVRLDGAAVGVYELSFQEETPEIEGIALLPDYRGQGLGRELLLTVMERLAEAGYPACWLQVSSANGPAWGLYHWAGFRPVKMLSHWYEAVSV